MDNFSFETNRNTLRKDTVDNDSMRQVIPTTAVVSKHWTTVKTLLNPRSLHCNLRQTRLNNMLSNDTDEKVRSVINKAKSFKSIDPDGINMLVLKHLDLTWVRSDQGLQPTADYSSNSRCVESRKSGPTTETWETRQQSGVLSSGNSPLPNSEDSWDLVHSPPGFSKLSTWRPQSAQHPHST